MTPAITRARGIFSDQILGILRIEPRIPSHQEYHKWRLSSPYQVSHSTRRRETFGLTLTSHSAPRRGPWVSPWVRTQPWGKDLMLFLLVVISPCSKCVPILVGLVMDSGGYLGMPIPTISMVFHAVMKGSQQEKYADIRILISVRFFGVFIPLDIPGGREDQTRQEGIRPI